MDTNEINLLTRMEVDSVIKSAEEFDGSIPFSVVGNIVTPVIGIPFLFIFKSGSGTFYDVIEAETKEAAEATLFSRKRYQAKGIEVKHVRDLSNVVREYYA